MTRPDSVGLRNRDDVGPRGAPVQRHLGPGSFHLVSRPARAPASCGWHETAATPSAAHHPGVYRRLSLSDRHSRAASPTRSRDGSGCTEPGWIRSDTCSWRACAARISAREKLLTPMYLTSPRSTSVSIARMVSWIGTQEFGQWIWYRSITLVSSRRRLASAARTVIMAQMIAGDLGRDEHPIADAADGFATTFSVPYTSAVSIR